MRLEIRLFARLRELAGAERIAVEVPQGITVAELAVAIADQHPPLAPFVAQSRVAASLQFVTDSHRFETPQEVALIPPVSGG